MYNMYYYLLHKVYRIILNWQFILMVSVIVLSTLLEKSKCNDVILETIGIYYIYYFSKTIHQVKLYNTK